MNKSKAASICLGLFAVLLTSFFCPSVLAFERAQGDSPEQRDLSRVTGVTENIEPLYQYQNRKLLESLSPYSNSYNRGPANLVPSDEIEPLPLRDKSLVQSVLVEDESGVLASMRDDIRQWQEAEDYVHYWNLESTGLYNTPDDDRKKHHIEKQFWRYVDRRLSEEINNAEEGTALHAVGRAEEAVRPETTEVNFSDDYRLRFRVRPLRGQAVLQLENPYVDHELRLSASGRADMRVSKNIEPIDLNASVNYHIDRGYAVSRISKNITDHVTGRITHYSPGREYIKNDEVRRDHKHEGRLGIYYSRPF